MLKKFLRKFFAKVFYPTNSNDWYRNKGYIGESLEGQFVDFLNCQKKPGSRFYHEFKSLKLTRQYIKSGSSQLDSVLITPDKSSSEGKTGEGLYFVMFQGRCEYYESRFRDMARQAKETGATVLGFNPKGFHHSTGKTQKLSDIVDDGIEVIRFLLKKGVSINQIIMQGNSLGGAVQEMVYQYYKKTKGQRLRQINSNSFKNLASVIALRCRMPFLESYFSNILKYAEWKESFSSDFYKTGPYRCYMKRRGDRTIFGKAEYSTLVNHEKDYLDCPKSYQATNKWLNEHCQLEYTGHSLKDPHELSLHCFSIIDKDKKNSVYVFINRYLKASNSYLKLVA